MVRIASGVLAHLGPILLRGQHRYDCELNQVRPATRPHLESINIVRFHDLETPGVRCVHPTCVVDNTFRQHPAMAKKPCLDGLRVPLLELFDDHEDHGQEYSRMPRLLCNGIPTNPAASLAKCGEQHVGNAHGGEDRCGVVDAHNVCAGQDGGDHGGGVTCQEKGGILFG